MKSSVQLYSIQTIQADVLHTCSAWVCQCTRCLWQEMKALKYNISYLFLVSCWMRNHPPYFHEHYMTNNRGVLKYIILYKVQHSLFGITDKQRNSKYLDKIQQWGKGNYFIWSYCEQEQKNNSAREQKCSLMSSKLFICVQWFQFTHIHKGIIFVTVSGTVFL